MLLLYFDAKKDLDFLFIKVFTELFYKTISKFVTFLDTSFLVLTNSPL